MSVYCVSLKYASAGANVYLRELTGHDELSVAEAGTFGALQLLDRLLVDRQGMTSGVGTAEELTTADRDRILAEIYKRTYGSSIESTIPCSACASPFDINFTLDNLLVFVQPDTAKETVKKVEDGVFELENGCRFRLPKGSDECAILGLSPDQAEQTLMERCLMQPCQNGNIKQKLESAMGQIAPVLETEMGARCPECGQQQSIYFDMQSFLLSALIQEREQITIEIHRLAKAYHWSHDEILSLPRSLRRSYLSFVLSEMGA